MTNTSINFAGNLSFWDYIIDASGLGDHTDIRLGLVAAGVGARVLIKQGAYAESTADVLMLQNQLVHFDDITITMTDTKLITDATGGNYATGKLTFTGTGSPQQREFYRVSGTDCNMKGLKVYIEPTGAGLTPGSNTFISYAIMLGVRSSMTVCGESITISSSTSTSSVIAAVNCTHCKVYGSVSNFVNSHVSATATHGFRASNSDFNTFNIVVDVVTTDTGDLGTGAILDSLCDDNTIIGVSKGSDLVNFSDAGLRNNSALLNTT